MSTNKKFTLGILLGMALILTLGSCGGSGKASGSSGKVRLSVGITADPDTLNPIVSRDRAGNWLGCIQYPTLLKRGTDASMQPYGADSFSISPDGLEVTFNLRKDLKWSDGTPFTSADVAYTKYLVGDLRLANFASSFDIVTETLTPDDHTIIFKLSTPSYVFVGSIGPWMKIIPKHVWEKISDPGTYLNDTNVVAMGPFLMTEAKRGEYYIYKAVDSWFQAPGAGKPAVDELVFRVYPDINAMVIAVQSGEIDFTAKEIPFDSAEALKSQGFIIESNESLGYTHTSFNASSEFLRDVNLRRALAAAIDKKTIIQFAIKNEGEVMDSIISPVFGDLPSKSPAAKYPTYNPNTAKQILADAGYRDTDGDGILNAPRGGKNVSFSMMYDGNDIVVKNSSDIVYQNYKDIGIDLKLLPMEKTTYTEKLKVKDFDSWLGNWGIMEVLNGDMNVVYESNSAMYYYGIPFADIDASLLTIKEAGTYDQIVVGIHQFEEAMAAECIAIPIFVQHFAYPHNTKYVGFEVYPSDLGGIIDPQGMANVRPAKSTTSP
ncbi:bacterial extracellular solute-binding protein, family 5 [Treponema primitia ZAS-2]|uniref:Bacterial extracellular solute-binding protein, family 5 n=1 Tax=Treponema primitia (strain ATCC BAA-887 / DSM 12427 / ZAS-2) TaxID=545694 RepID=F5YM10_TREPZ|nr:ABC transporter substrate-binding protein [Treponema primitia]AEF86883.1 bacterial extracellular solute-binding protein, family 5 [Treponema primitia ZAS-2]